MNLRTNYNPISSSPPITLHTEADKKHEAEDQLSKAIGGSHEVLISAATVFPFTLFPDTVTIDRTKLTITHRVFFKVAEVMTIRIEDILNVTANVGPIFGSIKISTRFFDPQKPYSVNFFWRDDALKIKRIMQGYIIAMQKEIDCSALTTKELARMLDELGQGSADENV